MLKKIYKQPVTSFNVNPIEGDVGQIRLQGGNAYRYVQNKTGSALAVGDFLCGVTTDTARGLAYQFGAANTALATAIGVAVSALPDAYYGWLQISGYCASVNVDGTTDVAIGDPIGPITGHNYSGKITLGPGGHGIAQAAYTTDATQALMACILDGFL